jgi:hypothetical protein
MIARYYIIFISLFVYGCNPGPNEKPSIDDLAGVYTLVEAPSICGRMDPNLLATISLKSDLSISFENIPDCIYEGYRDSEVVGKQLSGNGTWEIVVPELASSYGVMVNISGVNSMHAGSYSSWMIIGKEKPFQLVYVIGDPDSMHYLIYQKLGELSGENS